MTLLAPRCFPVFALAGLAASVHGAVTVTIRQVGSDVVATTAGSFISLEGLPAGRGALGISGTLINAQQAYLQMPAAANASTLYNSYSASGGAGGPWISAPGNFGSGGTFFGNQSAGNTGFLIYQSGIDIVASYVLGTPIDTTATWSSSTLASLGLAEGVYSWVWTGDSFTVVIGNPVPEPSTYGLILGGLALAGSAIRRRRKQPAA